ncbi:MAG: hypothetical protein K2M19_00885 [Muribaculaceae bacterium]|nr:hypothetical protein [Muribaculaceae bacterium]
MKFRHIILLVIGTVAAACGHPDSFRVEGKLDDGATINLRVVYHTDRGVMTGITSSNSGVFAFEGYGSDGTMVELYDNDYRLQARFPARNGTDIKLDVARANRYASRATGYPDAEQYTEFLATNAEKLKNGTSEERNAILADYIAGNTGSMVSLMLLWGEFDASDQVALADSLAGLLDQELRTFAPARRFFETVSQVPAAKADSIQYRAHRGRVHTFTAGEDGPALLVFSDSRTSDHRKLADSLHRIVRLAKSTPVKIFDFNCDSDTSTWRRTTLTDSATWTQGWLEGGPAAPGVERLRLPTLPYYIVVDSAGNTVERTTSSQTALNSILKTF